MNDLALFFQLSVQLATPFLLATLGGIMCEKAGHLNLGLEGIMMMGALFGFAVGFETHQPVLAVIAAAAGGGLGSLIYAVITVTLRGNQIVTGFALTIFGTGLANFLGKSHSSQIMDSAVTDALGTHSIPLLSQIPFLGRVFFTQDVLVYVSVILAVLLWFYYQKTSAGLCARMVGEDPATADAAGISVNANKYIHVVAGGMLAGLGGAYLSLTYVPYWQDNITAGMGWIAVALVIFSGWNPVKAVGGCYLFGVLRAIAIRFQGVSFSLLGVKFSLASQLMDMLPYLFTVLVLVFSAASLKKRSMGPASVGKPYFREDR